MKHTTGEFHMVQAYLLAPHPLPSLPVKPKGPGYPVVPLVIMVPNLAEGMEFMTLAPMFERFVRRSHIELWLTLEELKRTS